MKGTCETSAKKLARLRVWQAMELPDSGSIAVLSGPENGDARCLRALGVDPTRIVCVDRSAEHLEQARSVEPRATYILGDFMGAVRSHAPSAIFLDECRIASPAAAEYLAQLALLMPAGAPFAAAYMYGRHQYVGPKPGWKSAHEHWTDQVIQWTREALRAHGRGLEVRTVIGYKGLSPMTVIVGRFADAPVWSLPRYVRVDAKDADGQVRRRYLASLRFASKAEERSSAEADLLNLPASQCAAWKAVRSRQFKTSARHREKRRAHYEANRDATRDANRERARAHYNANRESIREKERAYREANIEMIREKHRAYRKANSVKIREKDRAYRDANLERIREYVRAYREKNSESIREYGRAYREANREKISAYYEANREKIRERVRAYREANREKIRARREANIDWIRAYREANREKIRDSLRAYYEANREAIREYGRAYYEANREKICEKNRARRAAAKAKRAAEAKAPTT